MKCAHGEMLCNIQITYIFNFQTIFFILKLFNYNRNTEHIGVIVPNNIFSFIILHSFSKKKYKTYFLKLSQLNKLIKTLMLNVLHFLIILYFIFLNFSFFCLRFSYLMFYVLVLYQAMASLFFVNYQISFWVCFCQIIFCFDNFGITIFKFSRTILYHFARFQITQITLLLPCQLFFCKMQSLALLTFNWTSSKCTETYTEEFILQVGQLSNIT